MWPLLGSLLGGAASLVGGLFQNKSNENIAANTTAFNAQQAQQQMDFQERMSNTAVQRGRMDMEKAGFNPILAIPGASSPGGASASGVSYNASNVGEAAVRGAQSGTQSAVAAKMMQENIDNIQADTKAKNANESAARAAAVASLANANNANANSATTNALRNHLVDQANWNVMRAAGEAGSAMNQSRISDAEREYVMSPAGRAARQLALGGRDASQVTSALRSLVFK